MATVYLHTGSNMGNRQQNLVMALLLIRGNIGFETKASSIYNTAAWGKTDQADFLNQAIEVETTLTPLEVLATIHQIEEHMGRKRINCLLYTSPSPRDLSTSRMPSSA